MSLFAQPGKKPRGMQWRTYWRLRAELPAVISEAVAHANARLDMGSCALTRLQARLATRNR